MIQKINLKAFILIVVYYVCLITLYRYYLLELNPLHAVNPRNVSLTDLNTIFPHLLMN